MEGSVPSIWTFVLSWFTPTVLFVVINIFIGIIAFYPTTTKNTQNKLPRQLSRTSSIIEGLKSFNPYRQNSQDIIPPHIEELDHPSSENQDRLPRQLSRTSSIFESLRSFNPYRQNPQETIPPIEAAAAADHHPAETQEEHKLPRQLSRTSSIFESLRSFNLYRQNANQGDTHLTAEREQPIGTVETVDHGNFIKSQSDSHLTAGKKREKVGQKKMKRTASSRSDTPHLEKEQYGGSQRPSTMRERRSGREEEEEEVDARADDFINRFKQQLKLQRLDSLLRYKEMLNRGK